MPLLFSLYVWTDKQIQQTYVQQIESQWCQHKITPFDKLLNMSQFYSNMFTWTFMLLFFSQAWTSCDNIAMFTNEKKTKAYLNHVFLSLCRTTMATRPWYCLNLHYCDHPQSPPSTAQTVEENMSTMDASNQCMHDPCKQHNVPFTSSECHTHVLMP